LTNGLRAWLNQGKKSLASSQISVKLSTMSREVPRSTDQQWDNSDHNFKVPEHPRKTPQSNFKRVKMESIRAS
jgi:hypothetical protein